MADDVARRALMETGSEDAVTVNQRALIDKILARYAAEFTVFRELIQNADDAGATHCQLRFETIGHDSNSSTNQESPSEPNLKAKLKSWTFKNDGKVFGKDDWDRLRRIAEGNPNPDHYGLFGVGFYSLFSVCEEPVVSSGSDLMGFFWKNGGDSLFTRRAKNPNADSDFSQSGNPWTSFFMNLREPGPFPESPLQLTRFLATSLTFTNNVKSVELWFDDHRLCKLQKTLEPVKPLPMPTHLNSSSPEKMMRVDRLQSQGMQIDVEAMAIVWEGERERVRLEREKANRPSLTAALTKSGGLTSMLQNAFGGGRSKSSNNNPSASSSSTTTDKSSSSSSSVDPSDQDPLKRTARLLTTHSAKALLRVATTHINVRTDAQFTREIERSTKKPPPSKTTFNLIWVPKEEYDESNGDDAQTASGNDASGLPIIGPKIIFDGLMPKLNKQGNVFIGFRTHQTTGFAGHVAARFIPTVERESIDFIDRHCSRWNMELLAIGGYACRAIYEHEMDLLKMQWTDKDDADGKATRDRLLAKALHTMQFFTMRDSSPLPRVSNTFLNCFFNSSRQAMLTIASTQGVKVSSLVRLPNAVLLEFVKQLPVIPTHHIEQASDFFNHVRSRNLVKDITMEDVFQELGSRPLDVDEMVNCLRWWINVSNHPGYDQSLRGRLLRSTIVSIEKDAGKGDTVIQPLASVQHFLNPQRVPADVPLPPTCLAYEVSKHFSAQELTRTYDWSELSIPSWLNYLASTSQEGQSCAEVNIQSSPAFAEKVFGIVSRSWGNLSSKQQQETASILGSLTCVPTKRGMEKPDQAYFSNVSLFEDLPIVEYPTLVVKGNLEKVLIALNVRRHVDLQLIFTRLVSGGDWSHVELLGYLASNRDTLSSTEMDRLTKTPIWPKEGETGPPGKEGKPKVLRYRAQQLYEPVESLRNLGLPVLEWSSKGVPKPWRSNSEEANFAHQLGLRRHPPLETILELAASEDDAIRSKAFAYFLEKSTYRDKYKAAIANKFAFVPCRLHSEGEPSKMSRLRPNEVFTNASAAVMNFPTVAGVSASDIPKLGLSSDPTAASLISRLVNYPPQTLEKAKEVFEYLSTVQGSFSSHDLSLLRQVPCVPIPSSSTSTSSKDKTDASIKLVAPNECYFGGNNTVDAFRSVFLYVPDMGDRANAFLRLVGVSDEPSIEEVASRLIAEPARFYGLSGSTEAYLSLLRQIATNWSKIRSPLRNSMKHSAFLLGSKRVKNEGPASAATLKTPKSRPGAAKDLLTGADSSDEEDEDAEDAGMLVHSLKRPSEVVIVDDAHAGMIFGSRLFCAPHEDLLQQVLYAQLGSPRLTSLVEERYGIAGQLVPDSRRSSEVKNRILERTPLFLFETRQSGNKSDIRRDADWLKGTLDVIEVSGEGLRLSRVLTFNGQRHEDVQRSSAMASMDGRRLKLYIAGNMDIDWFEVAAALNKFLLSRQRLQEGLLFMTLLSTSLRDLKRRGFHVDKILQQRKADRQALEEARLEEQRQAQLEALNRPNEKQFNDWKSQVLKLFPDADQRYVEDMLKKQKSSHLEAATNELLEKGYPRERDVKEKESGLQKAGQGSALSPTSGDPVLGGPQPITAGGGGAAGGGFFSSFRNRFKRPEGLSSLASGTSSIEREPGPPGGFDGQVSDNAGALVRGGAKESTSAPPPDQPSSLESIRRNVLSAISASRPDHSSSIVSQAEQSQVKEANSTYCDNTGVATDLQLAGEVSGMRVFVSSELEPSTTLVANQAALERLITLIYRPIGSIFGLNPSSMNIFIDTSGPTIAFNRNGTIFLNLRYYLSWFDEMVSEKNQLTEALISVYFSVAHEIAHNIEKQHNAQHEFYTSALCEEFFMSLANYIAQINQGNSK
ncbi:unnamed protein product [Sympodiomycopsis kandeliae]